LKKECRGSFLSWLPNSFAANDRLIGLGTESKDTRKRKVLMIAQSEKSRNQNHFVAKKNEIKQPLGNYSWLT